MNLPHPESLNSFIDDLMDPFKDFDNNIFSTLRLILLFKWRICFSREDLCFISSSTFGSLDIISLIIFPKQ
jgi:hypothetical protein